jgi:hypothetical protein
MVSVVSAEEKARTDAAYAAHRREQLQRWAQVPFARKLEWLEEAQRFAMAMQENRERSAAGQVLAPGPCEVEKE